MEFHVQTIKLGEKTKAGHIYNRDVFEKALEKCKEKYGEFILGEIGPRENPDCLLGEVTHKVSNAYIDDNNIVNLTVKPLDTPKGNLIQEILEKNQHYHFEPAGSGHIDENGVVTDYELYGFDLIL